MEAIDKIFKLINNGRNLFITGGGGVGKSYNLNKIKREYDVVITSTTGISALNVDGITIHSWAGVGKCDIDINQQEETLKARTSKVAEIRSAQRLAIDEISMLSADAFEYIDEMLRRIRECDEPFGGLQIILIGDFFQLPPVSKGPVKVRYAFESPVWKKLNLANIMLTEVHRQKDIELVDALNNIRTGNITPEQIQMFMNRNGLTPDDECVRLYSINDAVKRYNHDKLEALEGSPTTYKSTNIVFNQMLNCSYDLSNENVILPLQLENIYEKYNKSCRFEDSLQLKENCRVMLLYNLDTERGLVNGSTGRVVSMNKDNILVAFDDGPVEEIVRKSEQSAMGSGIFITRKQFPLKLAYAVTIHKSQGQTYKKVYADLTKIFAAGQTYVALSRVTSLKGLFLDNFSPRKIMADPKVVQFYKELKSAI